MGFKQTQWVPEEFFWNIIHMQTYNWRNFALCESTVSVGPQAQIKAFWRNFLKHYTHWNMQMNKVCALWKYTEQWSSDRNNSFQKKLFETLYTFKHTIEQSMHSVKIHWVVGLKEKQWVWEEFFKTLYTFKHTIEQCTRSVKIHWVVGFKQKQWLAEEVFWNIIHIQTYNWTKYALRESTVSGGLQAGPMGFRRSFSKHLLIQAYNWTMYALCKSTLSGGLQAEVMAFRRSFSKQFTYSNIHLKKVCPLWKYTDWWVSRRRNGFQKNLFKALYTFKHTIEEGMDSVKVHWVVGLKQKQWVSEETFWNILDIQTHTWTKYAFCGSKLSGGLQTDAMGFRRIFSKHYTHSNIELNNVCMLWKCTELWASSRSNGFQKKLFETF